MNFVDALLETISQSKIVCIVRRVNLRVGPNVAYTLNIAYEITAVRVL